MKNKLTLGLAVLALSGVLFAAGCQTSTQPVTARTGTPVLAASPPAEHAPEAADYTCPMHPEVKGKEGDKCPKCGMMLEPVEPTTVTQTQQVAMDFQWSPEAAKVKEPITLSFIPKLNDSPDTRVDLDLEHTKKIHLIVVSDDLSWFDHIHPEEQANGAYTVSETFPAGGEYTIFADYKPSGAEHVVDKLSLKVDGEVPTAKVYDKEQLTGDAGDGYSVELTPEAGRFQTNRSLHLAGKVTRAGKPVDVDTLEDYLGAKAHMVVLSVNEKEYLHVHPGVENGEFDLHTTFDKAGFYRGWIQFQVDGKVHTADFAFNVQEGPAGKQTDATKADPHEGH